jgi:hypothetical protein
VPTVGPAGALAPTATKGGPTGGWGRAAAVAPATVGQSDTGGDRRDGGDIDGRRGRLVNQVGGGLEECNQAGSSLPSQIWARPKLLDRIWARPELAGQI